MGQSGFTEACFDRPLPAGNGTITQTEPDTQQQPGSRGQQDGYEMRPPPAGRYPAEEVEAYNRYMRDGQQYIKKMNYK